MEACNLCLVPVESSANWLPCHSQFTLEAASRMGARRVKVCFQQRLLESFVWWVVSATSEVLGRIGICEANFGHVDHNQGLYLLIGEISGFDRLPN